MDVKLEGLTRIITRLDNMADLEDTVKKVVTLVESDARERAPKDLGYLKGSIESKVESTPNEIVGTVFTPLEYAPYQEFGTGIYAEAGNGRKTPWAYENRKGETVFTWGNHPQPFMRPALTENRELILKTIKGALND